MTLGRLHRLRDKFKASVRRGPHPEQPTWTLDAKLGHDFLESMLLSRHLDTAALELKQLKEGHYTIASAGHEVNVVLGRLTRVTDPSLIHYRGAPLYLERARQMAPMDPVSSLALSLVAARCDPASGGRHKVFGHAELGIIPQTSTIASQLPRAVGIAFALGRRWKLGLPVAFPSDSLVLVTFGDASINHSSWLGAVNAAGWAVHQRIELPLLLVCEDNGLGISVRSPTGWVRARLRSLPHVAYHHVPLGDVAVAYQVASRAIDYCRSHRTPVVLHLECVRLLGHWGEDADHLYRGASELAKAERHDPLTCLALSLLAAGAATVQQILDWDELSAERVRRAVAWAREQPRLQGRLEIAAPLQLEPGPLSTSAVPAIQQPAVPLTLAQGIRQALAEGLEQFPEMIVFGQDVATKGGIHGITQGLSTRFGRHRVFDTLLDEQTILGLGLGAGLAGLLPVPEVQYLAFLHNALDQLRGEAATLPFLSAGKFKNPMVLRIASFAQADAPGGHFHNENTVSMLRDIPGLVLMVPARADDALALYRTAFALAHREGRVVVVLEPTALYRVRDLLQAGDEGWLARPPEAGAPFGELRVYGPGGSDLVIATYGRGVLLGLRVRCQLAQTSGLRIRVLDLRWLAPLPSPQVVAHAQEVGRLLVVDDCRRSGGISEAIAAAVLESAPGVRFARVTSADCFVPIGPAAQAVLVSEAEVIGAAQALCA